MDYIDISMELNEATLVWKEDPAPELKPICRQPEQACNFTWLNFSAHAGTHIDAPYYLFSDKWTADQIPLKRLNGPCQVLDLCQVDNIVNRKILETQTITAKRLLIKTKNSIDPLTSYNPQHIALDESAAHYLIEQGVETLGFDYQSFERDGANELHKIFLEQSITLIDNLRLKDAQAGKYCLLCLPIKVTGIDAAPARAILLKDSSWLST